MSRQLLCEKAQTARNCILVITGAAVFAANLVGLNSAIAQTNPEAGGTEKSKELYTAGSDSQAMAQIQNVSQLRDVLPGDWAYEVLRNLVERYGYIAGYPNRTYRGGYYV
jgi:hypothetical protein